MFLLIQIATVFLAAITMSLALTHALELPGKMRLSRESYVATQTIYYPGFTIGGFGEPMAIVAALILVLLTPTSSPAFRWTLVGLVGLTAVHAVYWIFTHPVNNFWVKDLELKSASAGFFSFHRMKRSTLAASPEDQWKSLRNRWEYSHVARAVLSAISLICLIAAIATMGKD